MGSLIAKTGIVLLCLVVGGVAGYRLRGSQVQEDRNRIFYQKREGGYRFINPLLDCDSDQDVIRNRELQPFKAKVDDYLRNRMRLLGVANASVYFRELNDGLWFSIGETERYQPASMRKVPLMLAILRQSERQAGLLSRRIPARLNRDYNADQHFMPANVLMPGKEYTVADLLQRMIVYSDNNAFMLLSGIVEGGELDHVYRDLTMLPPGRRAGDDGLSIQTYASFFRILYNATYLTKDLSDVALEFLSRTEFRSGLVKGVPPSIVVAHKFGEKFDPGTGEKQLHDCGIIYYPRRPYLLCVMTRGSDFEYLDDAIATISRIIYAEIDSQHQRSH